MYKGVRGIYTTKYEVALDTSLRRRDDLGGTRCSLKKEIGTQIQVEDLSLGVGGVYLPGSHQLC